MSGHRVESKRLWRRVGGMLPEIVTSGQEEGRRSDDVLEEAVEFAMAIAGEDKGMEGLFCKRFGFSGRVGLRVEEGGEES